MGQLEAFLRAEARLQLFTPRFLLAAGQAYGDRLFEHGFKRGEQGACYRNAFQLAHENPELTYCEGRALSGGIVPMGHAWCIDPEGRVIDNTWRGPETDYFGVAFRTDWMAMWLLKRGHYGVMGDFFPSELLDMDPADYLAEPSAERLDAARRFAADAKLQTEASKRAYKTG